MAHLSPVRFIVTDSPYSMLFNPVTSAKWVIDGRIVSGRHDIKQVTTTTADLRWEIATNPKATWRKKRDAGDS